MRFGLLGPVAAWHDGRATELGSPQQRAVLALLLLHRNETVSTDRLVDGLWPAGAPPNAVQVLRTYVARLRAGPLREDVLVTRRGGYELRAPPGAVDADRFEALVGAGHGELERGDALAAEGRLEDALALVRGPPLAELPDDHDAAVERARLGELHRAAAEELIEARLAQGRHHELVPTLRVAVAADPLRERAWGQLMVALYRCGRQAEALEAYHDARAALDRLGLEPGAALRTLERLVLLQDTALDAPPTGAGHVPRYGTSLVGRTRRSRPSRPRCATRRSSRSSDRRARARPGSRPRRRRARRARTACGGSSWARWGRGAWSPPPPARSRCRRSPAARRSTGSPRGSARRRACSCSTTASTWPKRRRLWQDASSRAAGHAFSRPAARPCGWAASACTGSPGSTRRQPPSCSASARPRPPRTTPSPRSAPGSTACRSRSSSRRASCGRSRSKSSRGGCGSGCRCSMTGRATRPRGSGRSRPRSAGATTSSRHRHSGCCAGSPCFPAASTLPRPRRWPRSPAPSSPRSPGWSTYRCSPPTRRATGC